MTELIFYDLKRSSALVPSLASQVARELGRRIVAGSYPPDSLVEDETTLAERFHVSRSVIRDAEKILVGKGLLEVRRGIGARVRSRDQWGILDDDVLAWHQSAPPDAGFLQQLLEARLVFEPKAARWAAERAEAAAIEDIADAFLGMEAEKGSVETFIMADARFHRAILLAARNEFLSALEGVIYSALLVILRLTNSDPRENEDSIPFHREVYESIAARDADRAERGMERLLIDARKRLDDKVFER